LYTALTIGPLIEKNFSGIVHSTFERTANLLTEMKSLYVITRLDVAELPSGIRIDVPKNFSFEKSISVGNNIGCRAGILRIGKSALQIDLRKALTFSAQIAPATTINLDAIWVAWQLLVEKAPLAILTTGNSPVIGQRILQDLLLTNDSPKTLSHLIGRGPGLTPAGDDFIVGFLAGSSAMNGSLSKLEITQTATNDISFAALSEAVQGYFSAPLLTLIESLRLGQTAKIEAAVTVNLAIGNTSGMAGTLGVLFGALSFQYENNSAEINAAIKQLFS
jgi:hypothetical protein